MKLDSTKHKIYASRDGHIAVLTVGGAYSWHVVDSQGMWRFYDDGQELKGDWLPVELPKFPELPPKPDIKLCLVYRPNATEYPGEWRIIVDGKVHGYTLPSSLSPPHNYTIVPHPDNDPEAVRLIEEAQKK